MITRYYSAKEVQSIVGCGDSFIHALTQKSNKRTEPLFCPSKKGGKGEASHYSYIDVLCISLMYECRKYGIAKDWIKLFTVVFNTIPPCGPHRVEEWLTYGTFSRFDISISCGNHTNDEKMMLINYSLSGLPDFELLIITDISGQRVYRDTVFIEFIKTASICDLKIDVNKFLRQVKLQIEMLR